MTLNPMGINGPGWSGNAAQADYRVPTVDPHVASYVVGGNTLSLAWPLPIFVEKLSNADDPQGTIRAGKSGH